MSDASGDTDLARLAADLTRSLRDLQQELEPEPRGLRLPTPQELLRFTDEVAIPATILVLEANVRALKLLQRAIRLADGRSETSSTRTDSAVRERAVELSQTTLDRLDTVLVDLQDAIEGRPPDDQARDVLDEVRSLRADIDDRLAEAGGDAAESTPADEPTSEVPVDVDAELQSIKDELDDGDDSDGD